MNSTGMNYIVNEKIGFSFGFCHRHEFWNKKYEEHPPENHRRMQISRQNNSHADVVVSIFLFLLQIVGNDERILIEMHKTSIFLLLWT